MKAPPGIRRVRRQRRRRQRDREVSLREPRTPSSSGGSATSAPEEEEEAAAEKRRRRGLIKSRCRLRQSATARAITGGSACGLFPARSRLGGGAFYLPRRLYYPLSLSYAAKVNNAHAPSLLVWKSIQYQWTNGPNKQWIKQAMIVREGVCIYVFFFSFFF